MASILTIMLSCSWAMYCWSLLCSGRVFNGSGKPIDKGPPVLAEDFLDIQGACAMRGFPVSFFFFFLSKREKVVYICLKHKHFCFSPAASALRCVMHIVKASRASVKTWMIFVSNPKWMKLEANKVLLSFFFVCSVLLLVCLQHCHGDSCFIWPVVSYY